MIPKTGDPKNQRFHAYDIGSQAQSPYDFTTEEMESLKQRRQPPWRSILGIPISAQPVDPQTGIVIPQLFLNIPGRALVIRTYLASDATKASVNALVNVTSERPDGDKFPLKGSNMIYFDFTCLYFDWANQGANAMDIIILQFNGQPIPIT